MKESEIKPGAAVFHTVERFFGILTQRSTTIQNKYNLYEVIQTNGGTYWTYADLLVPHKRRS